MYVCMYVRIFPKNFRQRYYLFLIYANFFVGKCKNNAFERFYKSYLLCAQPNSPPLLKGGVKRCPVDIEAGGGKVSR